MKTKNESERKMTGKIQIHCYASCGNSVGLWAYEVEYAKEHGNSKNDIWNSDNKEEKNTTLIQMQFASILESIIYLNGLTGTLQPDTKNILLHIPSENIKKWLTKEFGIENYPLDRSKVSRVYKDYCKAIWLEAKTWNIEYNIIDSSLPDWLLQRLGWNEA